MKLAISTTFRPEKILSPGMDCSVCVQDQGWVTAWASAALEAWRSLGEEGRRALGLVLSGGAEAEQRGLEEQALGLARLHPPVHRLQRIAHGNRSVGEDLPENGLRARDQVGRGDHLVDQANAPGFSSVDHLAGQDQLQRTALADQPR